MRIIARNIIQNNNENPLFIANSIVPVTDEVEFYLPENSILL